MGAFRLQHRRGIGIPGPFGAENRAASSKQARFIRHRRRFACFPHTPLKRHKGAGPRPLPFGNPTRGRGAVARSEAERAGPEGQPLR